MSFFGRLQLMYNLIFPSTPRRALRSFPPPVRVEAPVGKM